MKRVLIIEDDYDWQKIYEVSLSDKVHITTAYTPSEAQKCFEEGQFDLIVFDGCVGGNGSTLDTPPLVRKWREAGFTGPMIAASGDPRYRNILMGSGCDYQASKFNVPKKVLELLDLTN